MVASTRCFRVRRRSAWLEQLQNKVLKRKIYFFFFLTEFARQCFAYPLGHYLLISSSNKRLSLYTGHTYLSNSCFFRPKGYIFIQWKHWALSCLCKIKNYQKTDSLTWRIFRKILIFANHCNLKYTQCNDLRMCQKAYFFIQESSMAKLPWESASRLQILKCFCAPVSADWCITVRALFFIPEHLKLF